MRFRSELFFYSPFSKTISEGSDQQALFLQFFLTDLLSLVKKPNLTPSNKNSPFYWCEPPATIEKLLEHAALLQTMFPKKARLARTIEAEIHKLAVPISIEHARKIFQDLVPLITVCKQNATLLFFFLRKQKHLAELVHPTSVKDFLQELLPLSAIEEKVVDYYTKRSFVQTASQARKLLQKI